MVKKTSKSKEKASYRGNKKPSMVARKKAPRTVSQKKKQQFEFHPAQQVQRISDVLLSGLGVALLLGGTFSLGSLFFDDMNEITLWLSDGMQFIFGKTAFFAALMAIFFGVWLVILRKIKKPFSFSWSLFGYGLVFYLFVLVVIQRFSAMQAPFMTAAKGGGIFGEAVDGALARTIGGGGALILLFFIAVVFILVAWKQLGKVFPDGFQKELAGTTAVVEKAKAMFFVENDTSNGRRTDVDPMMEDDALETIHSAIETTEERPAKKPTLFSVRDKLSGSAQPKEIAERQPRNTLNAAVRIPQKNQGDAALKLPDNGSFTPPLINKITLDDLTAPQKPASDPWRLPGKDEILDPLKNRRALSPDDPLIQTQVEQIEHVLNAFQAPGKVIDIQCGPTFTQFGIEPGFLERSDRKVRVRVKQIEALKKDLEMALSVKHLTIEAPIPGKTFVGLQVQNKSRVAVSLREAIESDAFNNYQSGLEIAIGKDINGEVYTTDLTRLPHLLIAGATGSGKSVCLNALLVCLLMHHSPDTLKLVLIDPKRVELTGYNGIPHLITPVVTEVEQVNNILQWVLREMDVRNKHFLEVGVRNIQDFNQKNPDKKLPYLVVVIDELANLMMEAASDIETSITRLAQTARAMGIHLVVATQRPSRDVLTGTIKGNLPSRIAFAVATNTDSLVILDRVGAENLFGRGDMYLMSAEETNLRRLQCVYVSDEEIKRLVEYWRKNPKASETPAQLAQQAQQNHAPTVVRQPPKSYNGVLTQLPLLNEEEPTQRKNADPLLDDAIAMVRKQGRASANMLVSRMSIGFGRANKLLSQMEDEGIISPPNANPAIPREVLDYGEAGPPADA